MARKNKGNWAKPVPGNTMVVTLPLEDSAYPAEPVKLQKLLNAFPLFASGNVPVPTAFKIVSVSVASVGTSDICGDSVPASVRFAGGLQYEQSGNSGRVMKCRPAQTGVVGGWHSLEAKMTNGAARYAIDCAMDSGTAAGIIYGGEDVKKHLDTPFLFAGELKAVTIAFRLGDGRQVHS